MGKNGGAGKGGGVVLSRDDQVSSTKDPSVVRRKSAQGDDLLGKKDEKPVGNNNSTMAAIGIACACYAIVAWGFYSSHKQMVARLSEMQAEQRRLKKLNAEIVAGNYQCKADADKILGGGDEDEAGAGEGFPIITLLLIVLGMVVLFRFLFSESKLMLKKRKEFKAGFHTSDFIYYRLDHWFSKTKWAKPLLLLALTFFLILVGSLGLQISAGADLTSSVWQAWTFVADPGTHADTDGSIVRLVAFITTIGGMLVFALMIGIISESIGEQVDSLKKGKSRVIESGHTLMLGWNDKSLAIIQQLALANESEGGGVVVVLSENDKEEMEIILLSAVESLQGGIKLMGTEVIFRSGNPLNEHEIRNVSVHSARSIICLSSDKCSADEADSRMVRQVLSLKGLGELDAHVVVELADVDNLELVKLIAPGMCEVIVAHDIIGRLMIQCARQPGLAHVLENLMGFDGDEFYLENWPELGGKTFNDVTFRFDDAVPIGIKCVDTGVIHINPDPNTKIGEGDEILVLAEDNDSYSVNDGSYKSKAKVLRKEVKQGLPKEKMLFCGWRRDMYDMIIELDQYVAPGSELWLLNMVHIADRAEMLKDMGHKEALVVKNLVIKNAFGNPIVRRDLAKIMERDAAGVETGNFVTLDQFDSLLILADAVAIEAGADMESSDSRSLASLLIIQDIQRSLAAKRLAETGVKIELCNPISEILDARTRSLLHVVDCKGYVMSNQIVSAAISQVSECRDMNCVLQELLSSHGNEPYLRPAEWFISHEGEELSFWDIAARTREKHEVAIGYKDANADWHDCVDNLLNPPDKRSVRKWSKSDLVIVISAAES